MINANFEDMGQQEFLKRAIPGKEVSGSAGRHVHRPEGDAEIGHGEPAHIGPQEVVAQFHPQVGCNPGGHRGSL